jgi:hypothetical protein
MSSSVYYPQAAVWVTDVVPMLANNWGLPQSETQPLPVREIIIGAVSVALEIKETS